MVDYHFTFGNLPFISDNLTKSKENEENLDIAVSKIEDSQKDKLTVNF